MATVLVGIEAPNTGATKYAGPSWSRQAQRRLATSDIGMDYHSTSKVGAWSRFLVVDRRNYKVVVVYPQGHPSTLGRIVRRRCAFVAHGFTHFLVERVVWKSRTGRIMTLME